MRTPHAMEAATAAARGEGDPAYLDAVAKEILRMRPVLPLVARRLQEPMSIGGYDLPAGSDLAPAIYLIHHREDLYPEPDAFRPERFLGVKPGTYTWLPFGGGGAALHRRVVRAVRDGDGPGHRAAVGRPARGRRPGADGAPRDHPRPGPRGRGGSLARRMTTDAESSPKHYVQRDQPEGVPPLELTGERTLPDVPEENYWYQRHLGRLRVDPRAGRRAEGHRHGLRRGLRRARAAPDRA
jgi:hypothetical protein